MTTIYLIRHSKKYGISNYESFRRNETETVSTEKIILDVKGEKMAESLSNEKELDNLDRIYTSNCVRTLSTAKYIYEKQNLKPNIDERFDERRVGIPNDKEYPDWFFRQFKDRDFKTVGGESVNDVYNRFNEAFMEVVKNNTGKRVAIFTHGNAMAFFLITKLESYKITEDKDIILYHNNKEIFNGKFRFLETFKLTVDDDGSIIDIENIEYNIDR